jgi:hypothetical protein
MHLPSPCLPAQQSCTLVGAVPQQQEEKAGNW